MDISFNRDHVVFCTDFDENNRLLQMMQGLEIPGYPIDFLCAGTQRKSVRDIWHIDRLLSFATDETATFRLNGMVAGGHHSPALNRTLCFRALKNGQWQPLAGDAKDVEAAEILESYEPAAPEGPTAGQPMMRVENRYEFQNDGTVLFEFRYTPYPGVNLDWCMGIMYQERCDLGGGNYRLIPGVRPFRGFDFAKKPVNTSVGPFFEEEFLLTPELWEDPACPPDRQIDFLYGDDRRLKAVFAAGYLPVYDGEPAKRAARIAEAYTLVPSRKTYPTFFGGFYQDFPCTEPLHGVAYRKWYAPSAENAQAYEIEFEGKKYRF